DVNDAEKPKKSFLLVRNWFGAVCCLLDLPPAMETLRSEHPPGRTYLALPNTLDRVVGGRIRLGSRSFCSSGPGTASHSNHPFKIAFCPGVLFCSRFSVGICKRTPRPALGLFFP